MSRPPYTRDDDGPRLDALFLFVASAVFHVALFYTLHEMPEPESENRLILYEVAIEEPEPEEPEPEEPEPEEEEPEEEEPEEELPEEEPPPEEEEPPPPPPDKKPPKKQPKQPPPSDDLPPPPPIRLPDSQLVAPGTGVGVAAQAGQTTSPGRSTGKPDKGKPRGKPGGTGNGTGGIGTAPTGPKWAPKSDIFIKKMPCPRSDRPRCSAPPAATVVCSARWSSASMFVATAPSARPRSSAASDRDATRSPRTRSGR